MVYTSFVDIAERMNFGLSLVHRSLSFVLLFSLTSESKAVL